MWLKKWDGVRVGWWMGVHWYRLVGVCVQVSGSGYWVIGWEVGQGFEMLAVEVGCRGRIGRDLGGDFGDRVEKS